MPLKPATSASSKSNNEIPRPEFDRPRDAFLFYSKTENLKRALCFKSLDYSKEDTSVVRKTRISFEKDPLVLMADFIDSSDEELDLSDDELDILDRPDEFNLLGDWRPRQMKPAAKSITSSRNSNCKQPMSRDAFAIYSDKDNLRKALKFEDVQGWSSIETQSKPSIARKTRISFEKSAISHMLDIMSDSDFDSDFDSDHEDEADAACSLRRTAH